MLGYHREMTYRSDTRRIAEQKHRIFWSLYIFDKNMFLLLGRASNIQDSEIDVQYPSLSTDPGQLPWDRWYLMAILLAKEQGRIYETQYSAAALKTSTATREHHINELSVALQQWRTNLEQVSDRSSPHMLSD